MKTVKELEDRADVELMINKFYEKVKNDETIGYFFTDVVHVEWEQHLPVMYNFWDNIIFDSPVYNSNPLKPHMALHAKSPMESKHFQQWLKLFTETVDELFVGEKAEFTKQRALSIATVMQIKLMDQSK